jgi:hypothetical protein
MPEGVSRRQTQDGGVEQRAESEGAAGRRLGGDAGLRGIGRFWTRCPYARASGRVQYLSDVGCSTYLMQRDSRETDN